MGAATNPTRPATGSRASAIKAADGKTIAIFKEDASGITLSIAKRQVGDFGAYLFDCDGTIADSMPLHYKAWTRALADYGATYDEDLFYAWGGKPVRKIIADPAVKIEHVSGNDRPAGAPSRLDTEMFRALDRVSKRMFPGATLLPIMGTGASDMAQLRVKGVQCYGIGPARSEDDSTNYGAHGDVERLSEASLDQFVEFTWNAVTEVASAK